MKHRIKDVVTAKGGIRLKKNTVTKYIYIYIYPLFKIKNIPIYKV